VHVCDKIESSHIVQNVLSAFYLQAVHCQHSKSRRHNMITWSLKHPLAGKHTIQCSLVTLLFSMQSVCAWCLIATTPAAQHVTMHVELQSMHAWPCKSINLVSSGIRTYLSQRVVAGTKPSSRKRKLWRNRIQRWPSC